MPRPKAWWITGKAEGNITENAGKSEHPESTVVGEPPACMLKPPRRTANTDYRRRMKKKTELLIKVRFTENEEERKVMVPH